MEIIRKAWDLWKRFGRAVGDVIARVVLTVFYLTISLPFGLGVRLWGDPLALRKGPVGWVERDSAPDDLSRARRLY